MNAVILAAQTGERALLTCVQVISIAFCPLDIHHLARKIDQLEDRLGSVA